MRAAVWFTSLLATPVLLTFCGRNWARLERQNLPRWRNLISVSFVLIVGVLWIFLSVPPIIGLGGFRSIDFSGRVPPEFFWFLMFSSTLLGFCLGKKSRIYGLLAMLSILIFMHASTFV